MSVNASRMFFIASLCLAAFGYGVGTVHYQVFPFDVLQDANRAWQALTMADRDKEQSDAEYVDGLSQSTVRQYASSAGDEFILVTGGEDYLKEYSAGHGCLAWITDRSGNVRHVWQYDPGLFANLKEVATVPGTKPRVYPIGIHLYADGGLLVSFQAIPAFPYGIGLARFDRDSKLIWKKDEHYHHWFSVAADGCIYALTMLVAVASPHSLGNTRYCISSDDGKILQDVVTVLDPDGNVLDEIPVLDALIESEWSGLLATNAAVEAAGDDFCLINSGDPTHVNDVQLVDSDLAAAHPWLTPGDLLLSLRNMNTVGILDPRTRRFKWMSAGATVMQHSPRLPCGWRAGLRQPRRARSDRGLAVGPDRPRNEIAANTVSQSGDRFACRVLFIGSRPHRSRRTRPGAGDNHGQTACLGNQRENGEVLWEYVCVDSAQHRCRPLETAKYVRNVSFPLQLACEEMP